MQKVQLKDIAEIRPCITTAAKTSEEAKWITPANLLEHNEILKPTLETKYAKSDDLKITPQSILIKRISPQFVSYIDSIEEETYAANNLILIRTAIANPKYLAFILNHKIKSVVEKASTSNILPSLLRKDFEMIEIPLPPLTQQQILGEYWFHSIQKYHLSKKLMELEYQKDMHLLKAFALESK